MSSPAVATAADVDLAHTLADLADLVTTAAFRRPDLAVETKPDLTPVTQADRDAEEAIRQVLKAQRPGDAVVGEEYGVSGQGDRRWIVDPIDGTKNFVRGIPVWATLIALEDNGQLVVGLVSAPALGRRWWAGRGQGAFAADQAISFDQARAADSAIASDQAGAFDQARKAGTPIHVSGISELGDAQLSGASLDGWEERGMTAQVVELALRCWRDRSFGDFWSHMLVAEGACDIGLDPVASLWDLAALQVIVEEAGGRFSDLEGVPRSDGGCGISSNGRLHDRALDVLNGRS